MTLTITTADKTSENEWPEEAKLAFVELEKVCSQLPTPRTFGLICAIGALLDKKGMAVHFSAAASANTHLAAMCDDLASMFRMIAKRLRQ